MVTARGRRPDQHVWGAWRGGRINGLTDEDATIELNIEANARRVLVIDRDLLPASVRTVGAPICARVTGTGASAYTVVEVRGSHWCGLVGPGTDEVGAVARGEWHTAAVPRAITGEPEFYNE